MRLVSILFFIGIAFSSFAQVEAGINVFSNKDTAASENIYYTNKTDKLVLKFTNSIKYTKLDITNVNDKQILRLAPAGSLDLGFAFNYKWLGLGFTYGLPSGIQSDTTKGITKRFDFQLSIYSKWFVIDALYQKYSGFYLSNPGSFTNWDSIAVFPQLPDMKNYSLGASAFYILNNQKFSYRAAYVRNVVQNKSAGSLLIGPFFNMDAAENPDGFVPKEMPIAVRDTFNINYFSSLSYGLAIGYTYSVIIAKKVFMNFSIVPGIGIKDLETRLIGGEQRVSKQGVAGRVNYRFAFGYEHRSFLLGLTFYGTQGSIKIDNLDISPGAGMLNLFVGKRFDLKKKK